MWFCKLIGWYLTSGPLVKFHSKGTIYKNAGLKVLWDNLANE